jgi:hypothetical protein
MIDFGYPQTTESKILQVRMCVRVHFSTMPAQEYITQEGHKLEVAPRPPMAVTSQVSWRSEGIKYRKNEVFLDVIESVNLLANVHGNVLRSEIVGSIKVSSLALVAHSHLHRCVSFCLACLNYVLASTTKCYLRVRVGARANRSN